MANAIDKVFYRNIDLNYNQIKNLVIHKLNNLEQLVEVGQLAFYNDNLVIKLSNNQNKIFKVVNTTDDITEGGNLFYTNSRVINAQLNQDYTISQAFEYLFNEINNFQYNSLNNNYFIFNQQDTIISSLNKLYDNNSNIKSDLLLTINTKISEVNNYIQLIITNINNDIDNLYSQLSFDEIYTYIDSKIIEVNTTISQNYNSLVALIASNIQSLDESLRIYITQQIDQLYNTIQTQLGIISNTIITKFNESIDYTDSTILELKNFLLNYINTINLNLTNYIDTSISTAISNLNTSLRTYIDAQDAAIYTYIDDKVIFLTNYIDTSISTAISNLNTTLRTYIDTQDAAIYTYIDGKVLFLTNYIDTSISTAISNLNTSLRTYIDTQDAAIYTYIDGKVVFLTNYIDTSISNLNTTLRIYIDAQDAAIYTYVNNTFIANTALITLKPNVSIGLESIGSFTLSSNITSASLFNEVTTLNIANNNSIISTINIGGTDDIVNILGILNINTIVGGAITLSNPLTITRGTLTNSSPSINITSTWNNAAVSFTSILANYTDTASTSTSKFIDIQVSGVSKFNIVKDGTINFTGNLNLTTTSATAGIINQNAIRFIHTFGTQNIFIGPNSGNFTLDTTNAARNIGIGLDSLTAITTAANNNAMGFQTLIALTTGQYNHVFARSGLQQLTTGSFNNAFGGFSGNGLITGTYSTFIGYQSGRTLGSSSLTNVTLILNDINNNLTTTLTASNVFVIGLNQNILINKLTDDGNKLQVGGSISASGTNYTFNNGAGGSETLQLGTGTEVMRIKRNSNLEDYIYLSNQSSASLLYNTPQTTRTIEGVTVSQGSGFLVTSAGFAMYLGMSAANTSGGAVYINYAENGTNHSLRFLYKNTEVARFTGVAGSSGNLLINTTTDTNTAKLQVNGNILLATAGNSMIIKGGTNSRIGTATLTAGTVTVANNTITANTRIIYSRATAGGVLGDLSSSRTVGTSFTITSTSAAETSTIEYILVEQS